MYIFIFILALQILCTNIYLSSLSALFSFWIVPYTEKYVYSNKYNVRQVQSRNNIQLNM